MQMLASMTTGLGFVHFVTTPAFFNVMDAEPDRFWTPDELIAFSAREMPLFAPGTSWAFSDTNFVLLGGGWRGSGRRRSRISFVPQSWTRSGSTALA